MGKWGKGKSRKIHTIVFLFTGLKEALCCKIVSFKINRLPVNVGIDILIPLLLFSIIGKQEVFIIAMVSTFLHELSHFASARALGYFPEKININMFGNSLKMNTMKIIPEHGIIINLSGPSFNIIFAFILFILYQEKIIPFYGNVMFINAILGIYNLLPFYPLDGGKIMLIYLKYFMDEGIAKKIIFGFGKIFLLFNFILGLYLVQYSLLNSFICLLSVSVFLEIGKDKQTELYESIMKVKKEQENKNYV